MRRALSAALLLAGCGGPAATVAWYGRSPDGAHTASVVEAPGGERLVLDGRTIGSFEAVGVAHLAWSNRGMVVPVRTARGWHVWHAGDLGPPHEGVGEIRVAGPELVYAALDSDGWRIIADGSAGRAYESIRAGSITIERGHIGYVARDASGERAVVDGGVGPPFRTVERLGFAGKGERSVYVGVEQEGARVVVDGEVGELFDAVHELALAPQEPRWAALVEQHGGLWLMRDGARAQMPPGTRDLVMSTDGARVAWVTPTAAGARVWVDGEPGLEHAAVGHLRFVPATHALFYLARERGGVRAVHAGIVGPRFDSIELAVTGGPGRWGYAGHREGGSAVVVDGEVRHRGEWSSPPVLAARGDRWAFVIRSAGRRYVVTPSGRREVRGPIVDTLVLDERGMHWAIATADEETRRLRVVVDGDDVAPLAVDELAAQVVLGRDGAAAARAMVASELARATR